MSEDVQVTAPDATGQEPTSPPDAGSVEATGTQVAPSGVEALPEWAQTEIKSLRQESAKRRKEVRDAEKAAQAAADATLVEQKKWQELADSRQARIAELEPLEASIQSYRDTITELLDSRVTELGEKAKTAIDGLPEEMDALAKLRWLNDNAALFEQRAGTPAIDARAHNVGTTTAEVTDAEVREFAARHNVNALYVDKRQVLQARELTNASKG
jgi:hypothetical protein